MSYQLTAPEKQKLLDYMERKRLESKESEVKKQSSNLYVILSNDFFEKIENLDQFKTYSKEQKDNFKANIADEILGKTSFRLLEDIKTIDKTFADDMALINALLDDTNLEEFFHKLDYLISQMPVFAERYLSHLSTVYLELCREFKLTPNSIILEYIKE
jgi:hypothetical protein